MGIQTELEQCALDLNPAVDFDEAALIAAELKLMEIMMMVQANTDKVVVIDADIDQLEIDVDAAKVQIATFPSRIMT